jgi:hypothetical protein
VNEEGQEEMVLRRRSKRIGRDEVTDVEMGKMDSMEVVCRSIIQYPERLSLLPIDERTNNSRLYSDVTE